MLHILISYLILFFKPLFDFVFSLSAMTLVVGWQEGWSN